jgi:hypothetical protein
MEPLTMPLPALLAEVLPSVALGAPLLLLAVVALAAARARRRTSAARVAPAAEPHDPAALTALVRALLDVDEVVLFALDRRNGGVRVVAPEDADDNVAATHLGLALRALETGGTCLGAPATLVGGHHVSAPTALAAPVTADHGEPLGALVLLRHDERPFSPREHAVALRLAARARGLLADGAPRAALRLASS